MANDNSKITPAGTSRDVFYDNLRQLKSDCGLNKHNQALMLIVACIEEGINTSPWIVGTLGFLGLDASHLRMILHGKICVDEASTLWRRDGEGKYHALTSQVSSLIS